MSYHITSWTSYDIILYDIKDWYRGRYDARISEFPTAQGNSCKIGKHTQICVHVHTYVHTVHIWICLNKHMKTSICVHILAHVHLVHLRSFIRTGIDTCKFRCMQSCTNTYMHMYIQFILTKLRIILSSLPLLYVDVGVRSVTDRPHLRRNEKDTVLLSNKPIWEGEFHQHLVIVNIADNRENHSLLTVIFISEIMLPQWHF
jgi:hypothetical protein